MKADTLEWVRYAEEDFDVATSLFRRRTKSAANSISFHCQQCVEKYLKARLVEAGIVPPKTHDLQLLLNLVLPLQPLWAAFGPSLGVLTGYGVQFRYPGHSATRADARDALKVCRSIRAEARMSFGLPKK